MSVRPLIAMTTSGRQGLQWGTMDTSHRLDYMVEEYTTCLEAAGALPVGLPVTADVDTTIRTLDRVDGLLLVGGVDITPAVYGRVPAQGLGELDYRLDVSQTAAARAAVERQIPILGICRGIQVAAVAFGGTLHQDLPSAGVGAFNHAPSVAKDVLTHPVTIEPDSLLQRTVGHLAEGGELWVNSKHHQAVDEVPPGFRVTAQAADGVVEALEKPGYPFLLAVQWHPEGTCANDAASAAIFEAFAAAAAGRDQSPPR